jgi:hypothetical protein
MAQDDNRVTIDLIGQIMRIMLSSLLFIPAHVLFAILFCLIYHGCILVKGVNIYEYK